MAEDTLRIDMDRIEVVVFDAMGVLYQDGDDVVAILIPLLRSCGVDIPDYEVNAIYEQAMTGRITSTEAWERLGLPQMRDEEYCKNYKLSEGTHHAIEVIRDAGYGLAVLSNDLKEWSRILRRQFDLESRIPTWLISGDMGVAKPDKRAFQILQETLGKDPEALLFVDDTIDNLEVASDMGINVVQFGVDPEGRGTPREPDGKEKWPTSRSMDHLLTLMFP